MGTNMSHQHRSVVELIGKILAEQGARTETSDLKRLLFRVSGECPSTPPETVSNPEICDTIGI